MDFALTTEQDHLRRTVSGFLAKRYDLEASRAAARSETGWQPEVWAAFADELGILGAALPESVGGDDGGDAGGDGGGISGDDGGPEEVMIIAEELGRALVVEPYVGTAVLGAGLLRRSLDTGSEGARGRARAALEAVADGSDRVAFACDEEGSYPNGHDITTTARPAGAGGGAGDGAGGGDGSGAGAGDGGGWVLDGTKVLVRDAPLAGRFVVSARTAGDRRDTAGISLFLLEFDPAAPPEGITVHRYRTIDDRQAADIVFDGVRLPAEALLGEAGDGWSVLAPALDEATAAVCAEAVGLMRTVVADTVAYAKQRTQFGTAIGSFQALQHRMVDMHIELEKSVSASYLATLHLGDDEEARGRAVSAAKVTVNEAAKFIGENAVQLHGGMGMTQELAVGHYFKRLTAIQSEFGTSDHHRARYARMSRA